MSIIRTENLCKNFDYLKVLKNVNLTVEPGEVIVIIGPSGAGKSTFLRSLNTLETITSGKIFIDDELFVHAENGAIVESMAKEKHKALLLEMGMVFQRFNLFPHLTVKKNIMISPINVKKVSPQEAEQKAMELLRKVGLEDKADVYPNRLSGGQQQRVAIARAIATKPEIIYFDEPTSALDPELIGEVLAVMRQLADEGMTMMVVTHEINFARNVSSKVIFMEDGVVLESSSSKEFFENPKEERTRAFIKSISEQHSI